MPVTQGTVRGDGVDLTYLACGSGPLALCLHGFPDSAYTWRHLMPQLADAGFHAVAAFMRGDVPPSVPGDALAPFMGGSAPRSSPADGRYQTGALAADAVALHEALGGDEQAVLIGHDWGAMGAYGGGAYAPP